MKRILIIEDDEALAEELSILFKRNGYLPIYSEPCDLVLMDVNLPEENGFARCRKMKEKSSVPVIFLTARSTPEDEILGFAVGCDDYIRKPYNSMVLLARIERLLKTEVTEPEVRGLRINTGEMKAYFQGKDIDLTRNEMRILLCLIKRGLASRSEIVEDLWTDGIYVDENTLYVNIARLRDKLSQIGAEDFIHTVRGVGYRI